MKRRDLARTAAMTMAIATWPRWLAEAFAGPSCPPASAKHDKPGKPRVRWRDVTFPAYRRAQRAGKPLLVLVIPEDSAWLRGRAWGELLNHGRDEDLALFALCEVICARRSDLRELVPSLPTTGADPLVVLVDTERTPATFAVGRVDRTLQALLDEKEPRVEYRDGEAYDQYDKRFEAACEPIIAKRVAAVAAVVRAVVLPDPAVLEARAGQAERRLGAQVALNARVNGARLDRDALATAAAPALAGASATGRAAVVRALAELTRSRLVKARIPGSRWTHSGGCGETPEPVPGVDDGDEGLRFACGMGHVPAKSARMLDFLSKRGRWGDRFPDPDEAKSE